MQSQGVLTIEQMCRAGGVSRAGFYRDWEQKAPDQAAMALRDAIQRASLEHPRYGGAKVVEVLRRAGWVVSLTRVQRVRRDDNLLAVRRRKFVVTTDSEHEFLVYPNLAQYMVLSAVNQLWVADITYLRLASEFAYFAVVLDAFSRRAIGWAVGPSLQAALPLKALNQAIAARAPSPGLVHHSDRGTQYACNDYVRRLEECQITISMSRPARPWENARCERFMRTLKEEEIDCREYATLAELERNLDDFIERFYNRVRLHAALGYLSPKEFEQEQHSGASTPSPVAGIIAALSFRRHQEIYPDGVQHRRTGRRRK